MSTRAAARRARRNPEETVPREAGKTLLATAVGVAAAVGIEKLANDMKKGGAGADKDAPFYSNNGVSAVTGGVGLVVGLGLHFRDVAPRVGKALIASSVALAAARFVAHRSDTDAQKAARLPGSRGFFDAPLRGRQPLRLAEPVRVKQSDVSNFVLPRSRHGESVRPVLHDGPMTASAVVAENPRHHIVSQFAQPVFAQAPDVSRLIVKR